MPTFEPVPVTDPRAQRALDEYFHGRELGFIGGEYRVTYPDPHSFEPPAGQFLLVIDDSGDAVGCGGIRRIGPDRYEVKHLYLHEKTRGRGWGRLLLAELERRASVLGALEVVLDTNATLAAAGGLYRSAGYESIEAYNTNPNATNWYRKQL
ncbi:GNAT family N-acetyltransferase [Okibacterium endophyticum]